MRLVKDFLLVSLVLLVQIYFVSCKECTQIMGTSGTIRNEKKASTYSKCWNFNVPPKSTVKIEMETFTLPDCSINKVEISLNNERETYILCPDYNGRWEPLILNKDFTMTHIMASYYQAFKSTFSLKYEYENPPCSEGTDIECDDNGVCSFKSLGCESAAVCSDGEEGDHCTGNRTPLVLGLTENRVKGIQWLMEKWSYTTGWQENTHRGVTALFLASKRNEKKINAEEKLMVKQLEVQALAYISKKETEEMTLNQLSMLINALTVSCINPSNFYGHDLVKLLKHKIEVSLNTTHPVSYLALCNAGSTLPSKAIDDLHNLLQTDAEDSFLLDVQTVAIQALSCLKVNEQKPLNNSFLQSDYDEAVRKFKELQLEDGSFGNIYTTATVTQALISAGQENSKDWSYNKALNYLIQHLNSPSADFLSVYLILPILNGKCLSHITNTNCSTLMQRDAVDDVKNKMGPKMHIQYTLNIGEEKDIVHTISLRGPQNITVLGVMQLAQDADPKYKFQGKYMGAKLFIYSIADIVNDFEDDKFWLLFVGKDAKSMKYTIESPDNIVLKDGENILMWYKNAQF